MTRHNGFTLSTAAILTGTVLAMSGCGASDGGASAPTTKADVQASTSSGTMEVEVPDWTDGTLHAAILDVRELNLNYSVVSDGQTLKPENIENTRAYEVVEQSPEAGSVVRPRANMELYVELNDEE